ncbi:MAG: endo-1,4-beta-xylanase [Phycisphaerales bacterium]
MLVFAVYDESGPAAEWPLQHAHLLGPDDIGVQGEIHFEPGRILCEKRSADAAALALMVDAGAPGRLILQTCLLPDRDEPYLLSLELARHRLKTFLVKLEDWLLFELSVEHPVIRGWNQARETFTEAIVVERSDPAKADRLARKALEEAIDASERLAMMHADLLLKKRTLNRAASDGDLGCQVHQTQFAEPLAKLVAQTFDFISMPIRWREVEPEEGEYDWSKFDRWAEWAATQKVPVVVGPLIDFRPLSVPDWLYVWEHDYDTTHDLLHEHIETVVNRYKHVATIWNVASSLHINKSFTLAYDQLMDLTRMATSLIRSLHPSAKTMIEITEPFGEYFAANPKSVPPIVYAETIAQSGYKLDLIGVSFLQGGHRLGQGSRDLMQFSALLDKLLYLELPVVISGLGAPSHRPKLDDRAGPDPAGYWHAAWSPAQQSEWLAKAAAIGLSKPFIESICIHELFDHQAAELLGAGLITGSGRAKPALQQMSLAHRAIHSGELQCSTDGEREWSISDIAPDLEYLQ